MGLNEMADERRRRLEELVAPFRVTPGSTVTLGEDFDPAFKAGMKKQAGVAMVADNTRLLSEYQTRLAAQGTWGLLMILQGIDASGKDGTVRHVMSGVNPQGVRVSSFKARRPRS